MNPVDSSAIPVYRWFESDGMYMAIDQASGHSFAELGLAQQLHDDAPDLTDAMLLADQDPLLQCLDAWSEHVFEWTPVRSDAVIERIEGNAGDNDQGRAIEPLHQQTQLPKLTVTLSSLEGKKRAVYLAIPHDELAKMPELPEQWQSLVSLTRHSHLYEVVLHDKVINALEHEKLRPGAFVILTESFSQVWPIRLNALADVVVSKDVPAPISAQLRVDNNTIRILPHENSEVVEEPALAPLSTVQIRMNTPVLINQLYVQSAWQSEHNVLIALPELLDGARVRILHEAQESAALEGLIMPIGQGFGVLLDDVASTTISQQD